MSELVRGWAGRYIDKGWAPVVLEAGSKKPAHVGWLDTRITRSNILIHFDREDHGIGLVLGAPSGGLVAVDLDSPEAAQLGPSLLPPTDLIRGRPNSTRRIFFYRTDDPPAPRFLKGLELKSTGQQVAVPPSRHPSGAAYVWDQYGEPARISTGVLLESFRRLAEALSVWTVPRVQKSIPGDGDGFPPFGLEKADLSEHTHNRLKGLLKHRDKIRRSVQGDGGAAALMSVVLLVVRGFCLSDEAAFWYLDIWNQHFADPPWPEGDLETAVANSQDGGPKPWGYMLITSHDGNLNQKELALKKWAASNGPRKPTTNMARKTI
jgi:hypothetical protein